MNGIKINAGIFPVVMSFAIGEQGKEEVQAIDLPIGANILYLQSIRDLTEVEILKKFVCKEEFYDEDYEKLFKLFLNNTKRLSPNINNAEDILHQFGVYEEKIGDKYHFKLIQEYIPYIKADTWDYITVDLLKDSYTDIINCFDFGDINIYLGAWRSEFDSQKQSLLTAFRSAFIFTLIGFLYGDDRNLYSNFNSFFESEFYKRISLIYGVWKHRKANEDIKYIPIFDSFYNLEGNSPENLIQIIHAILSDDNIVKDERMMIKNRLIEGANSFHSNIDSQSLELEQSIIKPVVNYLIEIQSANENISAAEAMYKETLFEAAINRSYYSMMHALKALLENKKQLSDWEPGKLNVSENHKALERKLINLSSQGIIKNSFVSDFKYVKQKRWIADYNISTFSKEECLECITKAKVFINEVKKISL